MNAPRLTFCERSLTAVPYFSLDAMKRKSFVEATPVSMVEDEEPKRLRMAWRQPPLQPWHQSGPVLAFEVTFVRGSSVLDHDRLGLAWARCDGEDAVSYVKDRLLGAEHDPSVDVLSEFFADVYEVQDGGVVVAHNLWWKSNIIGASLRRFGLTTIEERLRATLGRAGFCLMQPKIGKWLGTSPANRCMSTADLCQELDITFEPEVTTRDAALLCLVILNRLRERAVPPCQKGTTPHDFFAPTYCSVRDNGERPSATCRLCGYTS